MSPGSRGLSARCPPWLGGAGAAAGKGRRCCLSPGALPADPKGLAFTGAQRAPWGFQSFLLEPLLLLLGAEAVPGMAPGCQGPHGLWGSRGLCGPGLRAARAAAAPPSGGAGPAQAPLLEPIKVSRDPAPPPSCWLCYPHPPQPPGLGLQPPWVQTGNGPGAGFVLERAELSSEPS